MGDDEVLNHIKEFENWSKERTQAKNENGIDPSYEELERRHEFLRLILKQHPNFKNRRRSRAVQSNGQVRDGNLRGSVGASYGQTLDYSDPKTFAEGLAEFGSSLYEVDSLKVAVEKALKQNLTLFEIEMLKGFLSKGHTEEMIIKASEKAASQLKRPRLSCVDLLLNGKRK